MQHLEPIRKWDSLTIFKDWSCDFRLDVKFSKPMTFNLKEGDTYFLDGYPIRSRQRYLESTIDSWLYNFVTSRYDREMSLPWVAGYLPGNDSLEVGQLLGRLIVVSKRLVDSKVLPNYYLYTLLYGDELIVDHPYTLYSTLHGTILPEGERKWQMT